MRAHCGVPGALAASLLLLVSAVACRSPASSGGLRPSDPELARSTVLQYSAIGFAVYTDAVEGARRLSRAIGELLARPSEVSLGAARRAWLDARRPYLQSEAFRFYDGPIDRLEMAINTWPIDENYVEASPGAASPGIVDDEHSYPELTLALLRELNAKQGETSISTGYHVIEYLLWGKDTRADGPGDRPYTDYESGPRVPRRSARRRRYLELAAELLLNDLESVRSEWSPGRADGYRASFERLPPEQALARIVKGMGSLSGPELGGERLTVAYETRDQANEHSCFSDNTHDDIVFDALGIENVCLGRYVRTDATELRGPGLCEYLQAVEAPLAARLRSELAASVAAARRIPAPFDQAILGADDGPGRVAVEHMIRALRAQTETLTEVASRLGIGLAPPPARP